MFNRISSKMKSVLESDRMVAHRNTYDLLRELGASKAHAAYAAYGPHTWGRQDIVMVDANALREVANHARPQS